MRDEHRDRARRRARTAAARKMNSFALHRRIAEGRGPWYLRPSHELPEVLDKLRRTLRRFQRRVERPSATTSDVDRYRRVKNLMADYRRIHIPVNRETERFLRKELHSIDPRE